MRESFIRLLFRPTLAYVALNLSSLRACVPASSLQDVGQSVKRDYVRFSVFAGVTPISGPGSGNGALASRRQYAPALATPPI
jgi:hypothetical protein